MVPPAEPGKVATPSPNPQKKHAPKWFSSDDPIVRLTGWMAVWTGVLTLTTIATGVVSYLQWRVLDRTDGTVREQALIANRQLDVMRAGQRAWVSVTNVRLAPMNPEASVVIPAFMYMSGSIWLNMKFDLRNTGNTPATDVTHVAHLRISGRTAEDNSFEDQKLPEECISQRPESDELGTVLFPGVDQIGIGFSPDPVGDDEETPGSILERGPFAMSLVGCILYKSAGDPTWRASMFGGLFFQAKLENGGQPVVFPPGFKGFDLNNIICYPADNMIADAN